MKFWSLNNTPKYPTYTKNTSTASIWPVISPLTQVGWNKNNNSNSEVLKIDKTPLYEYADESNNTPDVPAVPYMGNNIKPLTETGPNQFLLNPIKPENQSTPIRPINWNTMEHISTPTIEREALSTSMDNRFDWGGDLMATGSTIGGIAGGPAGSAVTAAALGSVANWADIIQRNPNQAAEDIENNYANTMTGSNTSSLAQNIGDRDFSVNYETGYNAGDFWKDLWHSGIGGALWGLKKGKTEERKAKDALAQNNLRAMQDFQEQNYYIEQNAFENNMKKKLTSINHAAEGGPISTHGTTWNNNATIIGNGGTHESNPNGGVQVGVDGNGTPNMVEQKEVVANIGSTGGYVFSNRLNLPLKYKKMFKFGGKTFADAATEILDKQNENPNDVITKNWADDLMYKLMNIQEELRAKRNLNQQNTFACGGKKNMYPDGSPITWAGQKSGSVQQDWNQAIIDMLSNEQNKGIPYWSIDENGNMKYDPALAGNLSLFDEWSKTPEGKSVLEGLLSTGYASDLKSGSLANDFYEKTKDMTPSERLALLRGKSVDGSPVWTDYNLGMAHILAARGMGTDEFKRFLESRAPKPDETTAVTNEDMKLYPTWQRYMPIGASLASYINAYPDYTNEQFLDNAVDKFVSARFHPIGEKLAYNPQANNLLSQLASQANASRANAIGLAGGNRAAAMAYNTAANYNNKLADERALFNVDARNTEQRMRAADFNSKIDQFNSQGDLQAQLANMHNNNLYLQAGKYKMDHRDLVDSMVAQARGSALNALAQDMATIGENNFVANQLNTNKALNYSMNPYWGYSFYKGKNS